MGRQDCFLCDSCDTEQCVQCEDVSLCKDHLKYHKVGDMKYCNYSDTILFQLGDNDSCSPYKVMEIEGAGRGLVATRDISKGEHILTTVPAGIGPCAR